ncbi:MAG: protein kinase [Xenococcaceae cyanobacterium]
MKTAAEISSGTLIDNRYLIQRVLGQGGFGRTYLVSDQRRFDKLCVLKEFVPSGTEEYVVQKSRELFQREAEVLNKLAHPQIPKFLAWFEENGRLFLVQEYIDGKTYLALINERQLQGQAFSEAEVIQWLRNLLPVLDYIHSCNIIHRDISPDNIMLSSQGGQPVLIDLGIVKEAMTQLHNSTASSYGNSGQVSLVGKVGYSPSEQICMGKCYPNSDLYSLAVTALVLLTGKHPSELFDGYSMKWQWKKYVNISDNLAPILDKMLAETPKDRYQSAQEVLAELPVSSVGVNSTQTSHQSASQLTASTEVSSSATNHPLPQQNSQTELSPPPQKKWVHMGPGNGKGRNRMAIALGSLASVLLIGGAIFSIQSPHIPALCKTLDNCARDKEFREIYDQAIEKGKESLVSADNAQIVEELQDGRDRLNNAITQLGTIPEDVKVYPEAQKTLADYQSELNQMDALLAKEQQAKEQFAEVEKLVSKVTKQTDAAQTIAQYTQAKAEWEKVQQQLEAIPKDVFIADKVEARLTESKEKVKAIQTRSDQLIAQEKRRQEAARRATLQRQTASNRSRSRTSSRQPSQSSSSHSSSNRSSSRQTPPSSNYRQPPGPPLWEDGSSGSSKEQPLW